MLTSRCTLSHVLARGPSQTQALRQTLSQHHLPPLPPLLPTSASLGLSSTRLNPPSPLPTWLKLPSLGLTPINQRRISIEAGHSPGATGSEAKVKETSDGGSSTRDKQATNGPLSHVPTPAAPLLIFGDDGKLQLTSARPEVASEDQPSPRAHTKTAKGGKTLKPSPRASTKPVTKPAPESEVSWKQGVPSRKSDKPKAKPSGTPKYSKAARRFYNERFRESERLSKVLAAAGVASRRACEELIFAGRVSVNGAVCTVPQTPVDLVKDNIYVDGRSLPKKLPPKFYFVVNKPKGYICSSTAESGKTAISLIEEYMKVWRGRNPDVPPPRLFTVGRLDVATTGLLLITNDGGFAQRVAHPSSGVTKEYIATVSERVTRRQLASLEKGVEVDGILCTPVLVEVVEEGRNSKEGGVKDRVRVVVAEGRNREVRRMMEGAGLTLASLKRVRIGGLRLPKDLGLGRFKVLDASEAEKLASDPVID